MYCPICRGEYREGIVECPTCREPLTSELPAAERTPRAARLPSAATLAMIGTVAIFLIRTVSTIHPYPDLNAARVMSGLYFLAYLGIIAFFAAFLAEVVDTDQPRLKIATWVALAGCVAAAAIVALNLLILFDRPIVFSHPLGVASHVVSTLLPATSVLFFASLLADSRSICSTSH